MLMPLKVNVYNGDTSGNEIRSFDRPALEVCGPDGGI